MCIILFVKLIFTQNFSPKKLKHTIISDFDLDLHDGDIGFARFITSTLPTEVRSYVDKPLIDLNTNSTWECANLSIHRELILIPPQCYRHLYCSSYNCEEQSFRCVKIREALCCLYNYLQSNCSKENIKDYYRSVYFHTSLQHGYCEINLERIEWGDNSYCLANLQETTTPLSLSLKLSRESINSSYRIEFSWISFLFFCVCVTFICT